MYLSPRMLNAHWPLSFCRNLDNNLTYDKHTNTFFTSKTSRYTYIQTSRPVQSWLTWGLFSKFKDKHFQNNLELSVSINNKSQARSYWTALSMCSCVQELNSPLVSQSYRLNTPNFFDRPFYDSQTQHDSQWEKFGRCESTGQFVYVTYQLHIPVSL